MSISRWKRSHQKGAVEVRQDVLASVGSVEDAVDSRMAKMMDNLSSLSLILLLLLMYLRKVERKLGG